MTDSGTCEPESSHRANSVEATLLRLTELINEIAENLQFIRGSKLEPRPAAGEGAVEQPAFSFDHSCDDEKGPVDTAKLLVKRARPPLPDPRLIRKILRERQLRARYFESDLFADPAWEMLLDLAAARAEHKLVSVTSLTIASGVPSTTALRWIAHMVDVGLFARIEDVVDRRRTYVVLTEKGVSAIARYFHDLGY